MNGQRVLVDVTQFVNRPAASGVQRVLEHLVHEWRDAGVEARYGFIDGDRFVTGPISGLRSAMAAIFKVRSRGGAAGSVGSALAQASDLSFSTDAVERSIEAYFLPEPTMRAESLRVAERLRISTRTVPFFLYYDALPLTRPELFLPQADRELGVTRYHHVLARAENVAFISSSVRDLFEQRIARRRIPNAIVARPGADALRRFPHLPPAHPSFVVIGTVEPRKRHGLVLETFQRLWSTGRDFRLVVLGAAGGSEDPELLQRLRELSATPRVSWIEHADDERLASELAHASAMIFPSQDEGYGLPPLEALAVGCPVIVSENLPALADLPHGGQLRLRAVSVEELARAIETLADPSSNSEYRRDALELRLPTWREFADDVSSWIRRGLERVNGREVVRA